MAGIQDLVLSLQDLQLPRGKGHKGTSVSFNFLFSFPRSLSKETLLYGLEGIDWDKLSSTYVSTWVI